MTHKLPSLAIRGILIDHTKADMDSFYACIPTATAQQARKLAAFWNLTPAEQADRIARILATDCGKHTTEVTGAVLAAITGGRT